MNRSRIKIKFSERRVVIVEDTNVKLTDIINDLIEANEKLYCESNDIYQHGYLNGYHDGLVDLLSQMRIKNYN